MPRPVEISKEDFEKAAEAAEAASKDNCLRRKDGEFGPQFGIFLNNHLMMSSEVDEDGETHYYSHMG